MVKPLLLGSSPKFRCRSVTSLIMRNLPPTNNLVG
nr:MAG TPA: hypothetical protein [Caudoviricetes sp.]